MVSNSVPESVCSQCSHVGPPFPRQGGSKDHVRSHDHVRLYGSCEPSLTQVGSGWLWLAPWLVGIVRHCQTLSDGRTRKSELPHSHGAKTGRTWTEHLSLTNTRRKRVKDYTDYTAQTRSGHRIAEWDN